MRVATLALPLAVAIPLLTPPDARATTYLVKPDGTGDFPTIQAAVNAASNGDEILLADGTFAGDGNHTVDYSGKAITIRSQSGLPDQCVIDADPSSGSTFSSNGFVFESGEGSLSVLEGVRIVNVQDGPPDIGTPAGVIRISGSTPVLRNVRIESNVLKGGWASAVEVSSGSVTMESCTISGNYGGGLGIAGSSATLTGCVIAANSTSSSAGGGLVALDSDLTLESCRIARNSSNGQDIFNPQGGGGLFVSGGSLTATDCEIVENISTDRAGGVLLRGGATVTLTRVTIAGNRAPTAGGLYGESFAGTLDTSILWGNCATIEGADAYLEAGAVLTATCSDVDPARVAGSGMLVIGAGSLTVDPLFCEPRTCGDPPATAGIYSLQKTSPVMNVPGCGTLGAPLPLCTISVSPTSWGKIRGGYR